MPIVSLLRKMSSLQQEMRTLASRHGMGVRKRLSFCLWGEGRLFWILRCGGPHPWRWWVGVRVEDELPWTEWEQAKRKAESLS